MRSKMSKNLVKRTIAGYKKVNKISAAENRTWLENLSIEEARKIFDDLHQKADDWKRNGGNLKVLEKRRIDSKVKGRKIFIRLARQQGLL
jgi:hypothetical protein